MKSLSDIPIIWDSLLQAGEFRIDMYGNWHVGEGTDLQAMLFYVNLTHKDREFLRALKIKVD